MADYSTYITITNKTNSPLSLSGSPVSSGSWTIPPPQTIAPGATSPQFRCHDASGSNGSEGSFEYESDGTILDNLDFTVNFADPYGNGNNYVKTTVFPGNLYDLSYRAKSGDGQWWPNSCPNSGHPVYVEVTIAYKTITSNVTIDNISATSDYRIQNSAGYLLPLTNTVWKFGQTNDDGKFSQNPVLWKTNINSNTLTVSIINDTYIVNCEIRLVGILNGIEVFSGITKLTKAGLNTVAVDSTSSNTDRPLQLYGDVQWRIATASSIIAVHDPTRLELYWIFGVPGKMYPAGVWVVILRKIFEVLVSSMSEWDVSRAITQQCFDRFGMRYDTVRGKSHYGPNTGGGIFWIKRYYNKTVGAICNCYDQAGFVQVHLGALGISSDWTFMDPFGYINQTNLIGVGQCNNPFYTNSYYTQKPVTGINDPGRSAFNNHAFISQKNETLVFDACQGPVKGYGDLARYINDSIDDQTTLYPGHTPPNDQPGTVSDAVIETGIVSVNILLLSKSRINKKELDKMKSLIDFDSLSAAASQNFLLVNIDDALKNTFSGYTHETDEISISDSGSVKSGIYQKGASSSIIKIHVALSGQTALLFMQDYLSGFSIPPSDMFEKGPEEFGPVCIQIKDNERPYIIWLYENMLFITEGLTCDYTELLNMSSGLNNAIRSKEYDDKHNIPDDISMHVNLSSASTQLKPGDYFRVSFSDEMNERIICETESAALELASTGSGFYEFKAKEKGDATLKIYCAEPRDYYLIRHSINLTIV